MAGSSDGALLLGRPRLFLAGCSAGAGVDSCSGSKLFLLPPETRPDLRRMGVPFLFLIAESASDLRFVPVFGFAGDDPSASLRGTRMTRARGAGDFAGDEPLRGSACTVTLMRHGLSAPSSGSKNIDLAGEAPRSSEGVTSRSSCFDRRTFGDRCASGVEI